MCDSDAVLRLYSCALQEQKVKYGVADDEIREAIQNMKEVYKPNPGSLSDPYVFVANYDDCSHRCAYLHKYAPFHTALVADMLERALEHNVKVFHDLLWSTERLNICSLGGGPGSDIFGVLSVLNATFGNFQVSATVIDCMENWGDLFSDLITLLRYGNYGYLGESVDEQYFDWKYLQHNLLGEMTGQVKHSIGEANLVTMIKFVSASSCKDSSAMIKKIFLTIKPGCLVLYIDNAGGGFHQAIRKEAQDCNLITVFGPLKHELYRKEEFNIKRFGYTPCLETKVTVQIWRKPSQNINDEPELNQSPQLNVFSGNNQRPFRNIPTRVSNFVNQHRFTNSQPYSHLQEPRASNANRNFNSRRHVPNQYSNRSQPGVTTSSRPQYRRNQHRNEIVEEEEQENDECANCCVIS